MADDNILRPDSERRNEIEKRLEERAKAEEADERCVPPETGHTEKAADSEIPFELYAAIDHGIFVYVQKDGKFAAHMHHIPDAGTAHALLCRAEAKIRAMITADATAKLLGLMTR